MKKIFWTPTARKSLKYTSEFITEVWNEEITSHFLNQLDSRILQIQVNPELAPIYENMEFRKLLVHTSTSLFYKNTPDYIKILLVWDNRQDPTELLNKLKESND